MDYMALYPRRQNSSYVEWFEGYMVKSINGVMQTRPSYESVAENQICPATFMTVSFIEQFVSMIRGIYEKVSVCSYVK
jgi:hypothetical protein